MRVLQVLFMIAMITTNLAGQAPNCESREVSIPRNLITSLNAGLGRVGYHLNSASVEEHLCAGTFESVAGRFSVSCPDGETHPVDLVVPQAPILSDSSKQKTQGAGLRALSVDETIADVNSSRGLQIGVARYILGLIKRSCLTPGPAILAVSLWRDREGKHYPSYARIDSVQFSSLR